MAEENSRNDSSSTTIASTVIALQFIAKSRKSAQRRDQAVVEQPAGAARGRNLRDAILKKEQVGFLLSLRCKWVMICKGSELGHSEEEDH